MTYIITLDGLPFCYYGEGVYGWGTRPSIHRPRLGQLVQFATRAEADDYMSQRRVFFTGAEVQERGKEPVRTGP